MTLKAPKFLRILYSLLHTESPTIIAWSPCGTFFQVIDVARLEQSVLPRYFKHNKFASFQRQLNNFGFRKWTKTRASVCTFSHDVLVRCKPSELPMLVSEANIVSPHVKVSVSGKRGRTSSNSSSSDSSSSSSGTVESGWESDASSHSKRSKVDVHGDDDLESFVDLLGETCLNDLMELSVEGAVDADDSDFDFNGLFPDECLPQVDCLLNETTSTVEDDVGVSPLSIERLESQDWSMLMECLKPCL